MPATAPARLTVAEVARHLRLGTRKVYDLVARKGLPHVRAGGKLLFDVAEVEHWLARSGAGGARARWPRPRSPAATTRCSSGRCGNPAAVSRCSPRAAPTGSGGSRAGKWRARSCTCPPRISRTSTATRPRRSCAAATWRSWNGRGASRGCWWRAATRGKSARWPISRSGASGSRCASPARGAPRCSIASSRAKASTGAG
ncbi:MAG: helix-turn-helix domain-containing protein [Betaproteobacteria bacterium]|nr:helix-turn-helix domain-containing protein [Betaproteobacteria bacterium]